MADDLLEKTESSQDPGEAKTQEGTDEDKSKTVVYTQQQLDSAVGKSKETIERKWKDSERRAQVAEGGLQETTQRIQELEDSLHQIKLERDRQMFSGLEDLPESKRLQALYAQYEAEATRLKDEKRKWKEYESEARSGLQFRDATKTVKEIKANYGLEIDPEELLGCHTFEEMQIKAKDLVIQGLSKKEPEAKEPESRLPKHIDSGTQVASGTGRVFKGSEIKNMSPQERFDQKSEISKATQEGRIKWNE